MACESTVTLNTGAEMPTIGLGTWQAPPGEVGAAVKSALEMGYKHIDCAACYGNEVEIGAVFAEAFGESGGTARSSVFITSKIWNSEHAPADVRPAVVQTLADLQLEYLDLYLIHWPQNFEKTPGTHKGFPRNEDGSIRYDMETTSSQTWAAMEALVEEGLVRRPVACSAEMAVSGPDHDFVPVCVRKVKAIGLSNFNSAQIITITEGAKIPPAVLQVEQN